MILSYSQSIQTNVQTRTISPEIIGRRWVNTEIEKWELFTNQIDYLGHVFKPWSLAASSDTFDGIVGLQPPSNSTE